MDDYRTPPLPRGVDSATVTPIKHVNGGVAVSAPAGWYDDGTGQQRWWDGGAWGVYAQDVSSAPGGPGAVGYGQVAGSVGQPAKSSGVFNALGRVVKNAAQEQREASKRRRQEREELEQEARRKQEELDRRAGPLATSGVFGDAYIEIFENGYVRIGEALLAEVTRRQERLMSISGSRAPVKYSQILDSRISPQSHEKLLSISFSRGCGSVSPSVPALSSGRAEVSKELSSPGVSSEDVAKRLRDLDELRKEGILDDEEFLVAKRKLLGRL